MQADYLAAEDMTELIGTVQQVKRKINPKLQVGGIFLTMVNDKNLRKDIVTAVKENIGKHLPFMDTVIPLKSEILCVEKTVLVHTPSL